jgi:hypothetical protein
LLKQQELYTAFEILTPVADKTPTGLSLYFHRDVTEHLQLLLRKAGYHFHTTAEKEVVRIIKEKTCYLPLFPAKEEKDAGGKYEDFMLPDGNVIKV